LRPPAFAIFCLFAGPVESTCGSMSGYNPPMAKRFLYIVALAFILQLSWGTASAYCMHEMDKSSQHFGHHQHQHQQADSGGNGEAGENSKSPQKKAGAHPDCASCAHGSIFMSECTSNPSAVLVSAHQAMIPSVGQAAPYLGLPERPRWLRAVQSGAPVLL